MCGEVKKNSWIYIMKKQTANENLFPFSRKESFVISIEKWLDYTYCSNLVKFFGDIRNISLKWLSKDKGTKIKYM